MTKVDELVGSINRLLAEDRPDVLAVLLVEYAAVQASMTNRDRDEMAKLYPCDDPAEWSADIAHKREQFHRRLDRRIRKTRNRLLNGGMAIQPSQVRTSTRPQGRRREHCARGAKTSGGRDPGDDGDPDQDDPIERRIRALVDQAPELSTGQRRRLSALLGGGAR